MTTKIIRICYRKIINSFSEGAWEKFVFADTYNEFRMQAQLYNPQKAHRLFSELLLHAKGAEKLHHLVSAGALGYLKQLNGLVPDQKNALGKLFLPFDAYRFDIIESDTEDRQKHAVAVSFYSNPLKWLGTIGDALLLSTGGTEAGEQLTEIFRLGPFTSIYSIKEINA